MKNHIYHADIGTFEIQQMSHLLYQLWMEEELIGEYASPELAASDVAAFDTNYEVWDQLKNKLDNVLTDLSYWTAIIEETSRK
jgi:hypothetical protein